MSGGLTHSAASILRQLLVDLGQGTEPSAAGSWPVFSHRTPDSPDSVISTIGTTNVHQGRVQTDGEVQERYGVIITVRSPNPRQGFGKAQAVTQALDKDVAYASVTLTDPTGTGTSTYTVVSVSRRSGPFAIGKEQDTNRNLFTVNVTVALKQTA